jgi:hypothetical protein
MLKTPDVRGGVAGRSRGGCPPHGPHLVEALEEGIYAARCLRCGLVGPEREDSLGAKLAFDQRWQAPG